MNRETPEQIIERVGWMVQGVLADDKSPGFAYTIGLTDKGQPELIVFGLPIEVALHGLNVLARRLADGETIPLRTRLAEIFQTDGVLLVEAERERADQYMFQALYRYPHYRALQLVWADPSDRFPWDAGHESRYLPLQPLLQPTSH